MSTTPPITTNNPQNTRYTKPDQATMPHLTMNAYNSNNFGIPKDKGTGTNDRSMLIDDLAVLQNTNLPALAHDSVVINSMPRPNPGHLIRVCNDQVEKQIFIAMTKTSECTPEAQQILHQTTVLTTDKRSSVKSGAGRTAHKDAA